MITIKLFEIRDEGTCIPAFGIKGDAIELEDYTRWLVCRAGWGANMGWNSHGIVFGRLDGEGCHSDAYDWGGSNTMRTAHLIVERDWDKFLSVTPNLVDVRVEYGTRTEPVKSDRFHE